MPNDPILLTVVIRVDQSQWTTGVVRTDLSSADVGSDCWLFDEPRPLAE